jgi:hypothetical protein
MRAMPSCESSRGPTEGIPRAEKRHLSPSLASAPPFIDLKPFMGYTYPSFSEKLKSPSFLYGEVFLKLERRMRVKKVLILGAAGRDFHNFNTYFRDNPDYRVVAFTATQIPDIAGR